MSWTTLQEKEVKIKKPHCCEFCNTKYEPPTKMTYRYAIDGGDKCSYYMCDVCEAFMTPERLRDCDYEFSSGDAWEYSDYKQFRESFNQPLKNRV